MRISSLRKLVFAGMLIFVGCMAFFFSDPKTGFAATAVQGIDRPSLAMTNSEFIAKADGRPQNVDDKLPQKKLIYEAFDAETRNTIDKTFVYITEHPDGEKFIQWFLQKKNSLLVEEYVLNDQWETLKWKSTLSKDGTDYTGTKEGKRIVINGKFNHGKISKTIELSEDLPFYYNPKLGLKWFVFSDRKEMKFWGLRMDQLSEYKMRAEKKGVYQITVNGETFDALKIYWAATGVGEKFFKRTYYYRLSDGEFITQDPTDKWKMKLISLETIFVSENEQKISHP